MSLPLCDHCNQPVEPAPEPRSPSGFDWRHLPEEGSLHGMWYCTVEAAVNGSVHAPAKGDDR